MSSLSAPLGSKTSQCPKDLHLERTKGSPSRCMAKMVIKEEALPLKEQPEFPALALLASRGLLAPDAWKCKGAQVSLKATIDVPMLGTIIEQNGDGLLEDPHMPVGWPLHIDGAVRQCCIHRSATLQELDDMLGEYDMKRDSVEIRPHRRCWGVIFRMALVKRLQVYLGGGAHFSSKTSCF